MKMTENKIIDILMMDKTHLMKQLAHLTVPVVENKEEVADIPGTKDECDPYRMGYKEGYEEGLKDSFAKHYNDEDDEDGDAEEKTALVKKESVVQYIKSIAKKLFANDFRTSASPIYSESNGVSIINVDGELDKRTNEPGKIDVDDITRALKIAEKAPTSAVIIHFNSPGGNSIGIQETGEVIRKVSQTKPIFAFTDTICASAAYWLASCTNGIFATPTSELGSIGVIVKVMDYSESLKQSGINPQIFSAGEYKEMGHGERPLTEKEQKFIIEDIDKQYIKFRTLVNNYRGGVEDFVMQGQLFSGEEAVTNNLADALVPDLETTINHIKG